MRHLLAALLLLWPTTSLGAVEVIYWSHPDDARVDGFRLYTSTQSMVYGAFTDLGKPPVDVNGHYSYSLGLPEGTTTYVVMDAYDNDDGVVSVFSEERSFTTGEPPPPPPPPPTTILYEANFEVGEEGELPVLGEEPPGWTGTGANNSTTPDSSLFVFYENPQVSFDHVLGTSSALINIHSHVTDQTGSWGSIEVRGLMQLSDVTNGGMGVTAFSNYLTSDAYYRLRSAPFTGFREWHMSKHPDGSILSCTSRDTGFQPAANTWYWFRWQLIDQDSLGGTQIYAKVWLFGASEPSSWQIDCFDTEGDRRIDGTIGVWAMGPGNKYWDDFTVYDWVDTDGDGIIDAVDNCTTVSNATQVDHDGDLFGVACDMDYDNDREIKGTDFLVFRGCFSNDNTAPFSAPECQQSDGDDDGDVDGDDFVTFRGLYSQGFPGPSGLVDTPDSLPGSGDVTDSNTHLHIEE